MTESSENLQQYDELFAKRFTSEDHEYQQYLNRPADPPPIVEDWRGRGGGTREAGITDTRIVEDMENVGGEEAEIGEETGDGEGAITGSSIGTTETETATAGMEAGTSQGLQAPTRVTIPIIRDLIMTATDICPNHPASVSIYSIHCFITCIAIPYAADIFYSLNATSSYCKGRLTKGVSVINSVVTSLNVHSTHEIGTLCSQNLVESRSLVFSTGTFIQKALEKCHF